ncbi:hypothetical protein ABKV19_001688 [Rosa sericea]
MNKGSLGSKLKLTLPPPDEDSIKKFLTQSGTFMDGDLLVNREGVRIVSNREVEVPAPIQAADNQMILADLYVIKVIGKGNGGVVQLVQHKWTGQFFALKVIQMNIQESIRKQIAQELKINQSSQCPYIVVLRGLLYLHHEKHIIHRDFKPSNLLINHSGEIKITDFGVSAIKANTSEQANTFVGTYNYMSPERIQGNSYSYKSDIWSLGLVLLECATGKFPYTPPDQSEGWENFFELMSAVVDLPPPSAPSDQFSPEFCSFISACVQKDPKKRLSAHDLLVHPFISMYDDLNIDLSSYFTEAGSPLATF